MRAVLLTILGLALITPATAGAQRTDAERSTGCAEGKAERPRAAQGARVRPSDLSEIAASLRALQVPPSPRDGSYTVYMPGSRTLSCFGVGGVVTCQ